MRALVLLCVNQPIKFAVPSFTDSKDIIGGGAKIDKLAPYGTDGRLFATDVFFCQVQSHVTQKLGQI